MRLPSAEKAIEVIGQVCSRGGNSTCPVSASQRRADWSALPLRICLPSGEKATARIGDLCPTNIVGRLTRRLSSVHRLIAPLFDPVTIVLPSGDSAMLVVEIFNK